MKRYYILIIAILLSYTGFSQTKIGVDIDGEADDDQLGYSVAMSDDRLIMVVGVPYGNNDDSGYIEVLINQAGVWNTIHRFNGNNSGDLFGYSVAISGNGHKIAAGGIRNIGNGSVINGSGHVQIFSSNFARTNWTYQNEVKGEFSDDGFGYNIALSEDGKRLVIGAPYNDGVSGNDNGHIRVYDLVTNTWVPKGEINGVSIEGHFGSSVSISDDGTRIAVGAPNAGYVQVFENTSTTINWDETHKIGDLSDEGAGSLLGTDVAMSSLGDIVAIGAPSENNTGAVKVYSYEGGITWRPIPVGETGHINGVSNGDLLGSSVAISGDGTVVGVGAPGNGNGYTRVFQYDNISTNTWIRKAHIEGENTGDLFGFSVDLIASPSSANIIVGAPLNNSTGINRGHVRAYDISGVLSSKEYTQQHFKVYPNPVENSIVNIQLSSGTSLKEANLYDISGKFITSFNTKTLDVSKHKLKTGVYLLEVTTDKGKVTKKLVIK